MNNQILGGVLHFIKKVLAAMFRIVLFVIAWCFKLSSKIAEKIGDEILKISEK